MIQNGTITACKDYEDSNGNLNHFYEITSLDDKICHYINSKIGMALPYGTEVQIDPIKNIASIADTQFHITDTFDKTINVVNYQGFVIDCLDSDMGVYNLDNEIYLFGSGCLDLPIGVNVTLFNLHLNAINDSNWIFKLFGRSLKKSTHILVYCPAFSSFMEGSDAISYDNLVETRSNFWSLTFANQWIKDNLKDYGFLGFKSMDQLASLLFSNNNQMKTAKFIGHCQLCRYTEDFTDLSDTLNTKKLKSCLDVKGYFHRTKNDLFQRKQVTSSNQILSQTNWLSNDIIYGRLKRKNSVLFDLISDDKTVSVYCNESLGFDPPDNLMIFVFNALQIVEIVPKLRSSDSCTTKAYLCITSETKVWSPDGFFWDSKIDLKVHSAFISCKITQKYLILKDSIDGKPAEVTVIHTESEKGPHCFYLNPTEKFYGIVPETAESNKDDILVFRYLIDEKCFQVERDYFFIKSSAEILPTICFSLNFDEEAGNLRGPLQVRLSHLPYLSHVSNLQFFSLKLRFYSLSTLSIKLICSKCKSKVESGKCLTHFTSFSPNLLLSAIFETRDVDGTCATILIDRFSFFEQILGLKSNFYDFLIEFLKPTGRIKLNSDHFSFKNELKSAEDRPSLESTLASQIPRVSKVFICTFPSSVANSVLKPTNLEFCDPKLELINILKLF